jgi:H+/Cl- antiporter ClcA
LPPLEGLEVLSTKASTSARAGNSTVRYEYTLQATKAQVYDLDPIRLNYRDGRNGAESGTEAKGLKLVVIEPTSPLDDWRLWLGLVLAALLLGLVAWIRRRAHSTGPSNLDNDEALLSRLESLRELRLKGDHIGFVALCQSLASGAGLESETYINSDLANAVQYGGHRIPEIDLDQIERTLKADLNVSD